MKDARRVGAKTWLQPNLRRTWCLPISIPPACINSLFFSTVFSRASNPAKMFGYIASILGFHGQANSTNVAPAYTSSLPVPRSYSNCQGYGPNLPRTDLRLKFSNQTSETVRIFGFPPQEDYPKSGWYPPPAFGLEGPYITYLLGKSPASVKYIMGDDWRSNLQSDPRFPPMDSRQSQVVLRPSVVSNGTCDTEAVLEDENDPAILAEERTHSLRMRRCGALPVAVQDDIEKFDWEHVFWPHDYFFGWPASGGVWVLRIWSSDSEPEISADQYRTDEEIMEQNLQDALKYEQRYENYIALAGKLNQQEDMEDVCRVLEEAGAQF